MAGRPPVWVPPLSWPSYRRGASIGSGDLRRRTVSVPFLSASFFFLHLSRLHGGAGRPLSRLPPSRGAPQAPSSFSGEASSLHDSIAVSPVPASSVSCIHLSCALAVPAVHAGLQMSLPPLLCCRPLLVLVRIVVVGTLWELHHQTRNARSKFSTGLVSRDEPPRPSAGSKVDNLAPGYLELIRSSPRTERSIRKNGASAVSGDLFTPPARLARRRRPQPEMTARVWRSSARHGQRASDPLRHSS